MTTWLVACGTSESPTPTTIRAVVHVDDGIAIGSPVRGVTVVFHDDTGAVTTTVTTDDDGVAEATGSGVTFVHEQSQVSVLGLSPGDEVLGHVLPNLDAQTHYEVELSMPSRPATGDHYLYWTPCGGARTSTLTPTVVVDLPESCSKGHEYAVVFVEDARGRALSHSTAKGFALSTEGRTNVAMPAWSDAWKNTSIELVGGPTTLTRVSAFAVPVVDGQTMRYWLPRPSPVDYEPGNAVSFDASIPDDVDDVWYVVQAWFGDETAEIVEARTFEPSIRFDLDELLPRISDLETSQTETERPCATWTYAAPPVNADGAVTTFFFADAATRFWNVLAPLDHQGPVCAPALPPSIAQERLGRYTGVDIDLLDASYYSSDHERATAGDARFFATGAAHPWRVVLSRAREQIQ